MTSYGIKNKHCGNFNIKLTLQLECKNDDVVKGLDIELNGEKEKVNEDDDVHYKRSIEIEGDVKKTLATKPVKYLLKDLQKYLSIRYDKSELPPDDEL